MSILIQEFHFESRVAVSVLAFLTYDACLTMADEDKMVNAQGAISYDKILPIGFYVIDCLFYSSYYGINRIGEYNYAPRELPDKSSTFHLLVCDLVTNVYTSVQVISVLHIPEFPMCTFLVKQDPGKVINETSLLAEISSILTMFIFLSFTIVKFYFMVISSKPGWWRLARLQEISSSTPLIVVYMRDGIMFIFIAFATKPLWNEWLIAAYSLCASRLIINLRSTERDLANTHMTTLQFFSGGTGVSENSDRGMDQIERDSDSV
ncbi:hypothetical protein BDQ12DRAFT_670013 [Crucibulum laeve]|uniref:Uncharacterized protein n=1 Tax=Crucibulum laeve TaxID=68775 RepID=A0A5C3LL02_9AGAR|nr:hypothetical protein BDQ12DRAFT_670013 [Crucibulum laeve]